MDVLAFLLAILSGKKVPTATAADEGSVVVVDNTGAYTLGTPTGATVSVSNHTLTIPQEV